MTRFLAAPLLIFAASISNGMAMDMDASNSTRVDELFRLYVLGARCEVAAFSWTENDLYEVERLLETELPDVLEELWEAKWTGAIASARVAVISEAVCLEKLSSVVEGRR